MIIQLGASMNRVGKTTTLSTKLRDVDTAVSELRERTSKDAKPLDGSWRSLVPLTLTPMARRIRKPTRRGAMGHEVHVRLQVGAMHQTRPAPA